MKMGVRERFGESHGGQEVQRLVGKGTTKTVSQEELVTHV